MDITKVLATLQRAPYEPFCQASDRNLIHKTVFLLALVSAKRVGDLQDLMLLPMLRVRCPCPCSFIVEFVARLKTPQIQRFFNPSLKDFVEGDKMMLLGPVRTLEQFLKGTAPWRPGCKRLIISQGQNGGGGSLETPTSGGDKSSQGPTTLTGTAVSRKNKGP